MNECSCCHEQLGEAGYCINIDCEKAQQYATAGAARQTAKATAGSYEPRAFTSSGRVD